MIGTTLVSVKRRDTKVKRGDTLPLCDRETVSRGYKLLRIFSYFVVSLYSTLKKDNESVDTISVDRRRFDSFKTVSILKNEIKRKWWIQTYKVGEGGN